MRINNYFEIFILFGETFRYRYLKSNVWKTYLKQLIRRQIIIVHRRWIRLHKNHEPRGVTKISTLEINNEVRSMSFQIIVIVTESTVKCERRTWAQYYLFQSHPKRGGKLPTDFRNIRWKITKAGRGSLWIWVAVCINTIIYIYID